MTKVKKTQLTLIIGAVVLFVLLFFANKKPSVKPAGEVEAQPGNNETIESFVTAAKKF